MPRPQKDLKGRYNGYLTAQIPMQEMIETYEDHYPAEIGRSAAGLTYLELGTALADEEEPESGDMTYEVIAAEAERDGKDTALIDRHYLAWFEGHGPEVNWDAIVDFLWGPATQ